MKNFCIDCKKPLKHQGRCRECYKTFSKGLNTTNWKGGMKKENGYIFILKHGHPTSRCDGYIKRSRLLMEQYLRRYLTNKEIVHHKNDIKDDDRIENLEVVTKQEHHAKHWTKEKNPNWIDGRKYDKEYVKDYRKKWMREFRKKNPEYEKEKKLRLKKRFNKRCPYCNKLISKWNKTCIKCYLDNKKIFRDEKGRFTN